MNCPVHRGLTNTKASDADSILASSDAFLLAFKAAGVGSLQWASYDR